MRDNDTSEALRNITRLIIASWEPTLEVSVETDADVKVREDE